MKIIITESQLSNFFKKVSSLSPKDKEKGFFIKLKELLGNKDQFIGELILKSIKSGNVGLTRVVDLGDMEWDIYFSIDSIPFVISRLIGSGRGWSSALEYFVIKSPMFGDEELEINQDVALKIFDSLYHLSRQ
jgi:hypothetical protein